MAVTGLGDYGHAGLMGVLTPQANTTVEPELWALLPRGWSLVNARLTSDKGTIEERLVDYTRRFETVAEEFANAPVATLAAACTGASYLIGRDAEAGLADRIESRFGVPFVTAAIAAAASLRGMGASRIALLTPYPETLNAASRPYWEAHGFEVVASSGPELETSAFHPIYAMSAPGVLGAYRALSETDAHAVLMLGTGMPTLGPLIDGQREGLMPAVSCNLALVGAATQKRSWRDLDYDALGEFCRNGAWHARFSALFA